MSTFLPAVLHPHSQCLSSSWWLSEIPGGLRASMTWGRLGWLWLPWQTWSWTCPSQQIILGLNYPSSSCIERRILITAEQESYPWGCQGREQQQILAGHEQAEHWAAAASCQSPPHSPGSCLCCVGQLSPAWELLWGWVICSFRLPPCSPRLEQLPRAPWRSRRAEVGREA